MILSCNHEYSCLLSPNMSMFLMSEAQNRLWLTDRWWWRLSIFMLQSLAMIKMYTGFVNAHRDGVIISQIAKFTLLHLIWIQLSSVYFSDTKSQQQPPQGTLCCKTPQYWENPNKHLATVGRKNCEGPRPRLRHANWTQRPVGVTGGTHGPREVVRTVQPCCSFSVTHTPKKSRKPSKKIIYLQTLHSMFVRNQRAHPLCLGLTLICWFCAGNLYGSTLIYIHEEIFS